MTTETQDKTSDLDILFPGVEVPVMMRGKTKPEMVRVEPFYALQFAKAIAKCKPLAKAIASIAVVDADGKAVRLKFDGDLPEFMERILTSADDGVSAVIDLLAITLNKPRAWFEDVPTDGLFDLAKAMFDQNKDFFVRRILPLLQAWVPGANTPAAAGATSTPDSYLPATPELVLTE
jgi:hypothetical protein